MRLHSKIILTIVPLVLAAILGLGFWSYTTAHKISVNSLNKYIESTLDVHFLAELRQRVNLLDKAKMSKVEYFVNSYKQEALRQFREDAKNIEGSHVFIFTDTGELLFSSSDQTRKSMEAAWSDIAMQTIATEHTVGHFQSPPYQSYFAAQYFRPWKWVLFFSMEDAKIVQSLLQIRRTTIAVATIFGVVTILLLINIFKFLLIRPIQELQYAATQISKQQPLPPMALRTKDELGVLAREMEIMAMAISTHNHEQLLLQRDLEQSNASLLESEERFRLAFLMAPFPIMIHAEDGEILQINTTWTELTGYSRDEIPTIDKWLQKVHDHDSKKIRDVINRLYTLENRVHEGEFDIITARKQKMIWDFSSAPLGKDKYGRRLVISMARDITESKRIVNEKIQLEQKLNQAQKLESVGRLAGGVAHDYNNALSVIIGFTELAMEDLDPTGPVYNDLEEVLTAAKKAADITKQLLAFARKQTIAPRKIDLNQTVNNMLKILQHLIGENINLTWSPWTPLPPIKIDPSQIDQILANLCVNARDAIVDVGKISLETGVSTFDESYCSNHAGYIPGDFVMLAVSDDGRGIEKELIDKIFEPFFTTKSVDKGTGLGLATVYGNVKQTGGFINVQSEPNIGTCVKIYFPVYEGGTVEIDQDITPPAEMCHGETVLLTEDDQSILKYSRKILEKTGYTVLSTDIVDDAITLAKEYDSTIHLLITDVIMPKMNGHELFKRIQPLQPDIKVLYVSGYTADIIAHHGVLEEDVNFLQKPFSQNELTHAVRKALDR